MGLAGEVASLRTEDLALELYQSASFFGKVCQLLHFLRLLSGTGSTAALAENSSVYHKRQTPDLTMAMKPLNAEEEKEN